MWDIDKIQQMKEADGDCYTALLYINALYGIELLRYVDYGNVTLPLAWQYGQYYQTVWKDDPSMVERFMHQNDQALKKFNLKKAKDMVKELIRRRFTILDTRLTKATPLEPALVNSIYSNIDNVLCSERTFDLIAAENRIDLSKPGTTVRHSRTAITPLEIVDRLLMGTFDTYQELGDPRKSEPAIQKELHDSKVYLCIKAIEKIVDMEVAEYIRDTYYDNISLYASLLSIAYRLKLPHGMEPARMDYYYDTFIKTDKSYPLALERARRFSGYPAEVVACKGLPSICKCFKAPDGLQSKYYPNCTYPNSVVEKYLVTEWMVQTQARDILS